MRFCQLTFWIDARAAFLCLALLFSAASPGQSDDVWSFAKHPHPWYHRDMTEEERALVDRLVEQSSKGPCTATMEAEYHIYLRRYPAYARAGDAESNLARWKEHLARDLNGYMAICLSGIADWKLHRMPKLPTDFYFCGRYSRPPETAYERKLAKWVGELFMYAQTGLSYPVWNFLAAQDAYAAIDLNPDVEYYFYQFYDPMDDDIIPADTSHLEGLLSTERKAFVKQAAKAKDIVPVLETTPPCKPREVELTGQRL